jgi:predicted dienelactone hydrolase
MWRGLGIVALVGCAQGGSEDDPPEAPPALDVREPGPYGVGWRAEVWTYTTPDGRERAMTGQVWFPTDATSGGPVAYTDGFPSPLPGELADVAPAAAPAGGWPVLVHSHGHQATGGSGQPLAVWLVSHGWVVIAPDHAPNLFRTILGGENTPPEHWLDRPGDVSAALDRLGALPEGDPLRGAAAVEQAMVSGHSRGVTTTWSVLGAPFDPTAIEGLCPGCEAGTLDAMRAGVGDARFVAGIPMAGMMPESMFGADGEASVTAPVLSMTGSVDVPDAEARLATLGGVDLSWVELAGGCHESFASGIPCPGLDTAVAFRAIGVYALAFGRRHLLGDDDPTVLGVLDGSVEVDGAATVRLGVNE